MVSSIFDLFVALNLPPFSGFHPQIPPKTSYLHVLQAADFLPNDYQPQDFDAAALSFTSLGVNTQQCC